MTSDTQSLFHKLPHKLPIEIKNNSDSDYLYKNPIKEAQGHDFDCKHKGAIKGRFL